MAPTEAPSMSGSDISELASIFADAPGGSNNPIDESTPPASESIPTGDPSSATTPPSGDTPAAPADATASGYQLTEDGAHYLVPKNEVSLYGGLKEYADRVQARFPTAQDAEAAHFQASDLRALSSDYLSGDKRGIDAFLNYFRGDLKGVPPDQQRAYEASFAAMVPRAAEMLAKNNPQAHQEFTQSIYQTAIDQAYARAAETQTDEDFQVARALDWAITGNYKEDMPGRPDPNKNAQQLEQTRAQQLEAREKQLYDRDFKYFDQTQMDGPKWSTFRQEIDKILKPIEDKYQPGHMTAVKRQIQDDVISALQKDYEWSRDHNNERISIAREYEKAWKNQQPSQFLNPRLQRYQSDFMSRVRRVLPSIAKNYVGQATQSVVKASPKTQTPAAAPAAAPNRAPNGRPAPAPEFDVYDAVRDAMKVK